MDRSDFTIRSPDSPAEWELAADLVKEYVDQLGLDLALQSYRGESPDFSTHYAAPHGSFLLAFVGEALAGCCAIRPLFEAVDANACEMKRLYVRPAFRRFGLGRLLVESAFEGARRLGYASVLLDTLDEMEAARNLYADLGFEEVPPYHLSPIPGTHYLKARL
jgi:GNAT superfamily N-acetyltransferase